MKISANQKRLLITRIRHSNVNRLRPDAQLVFVLSMLVANDDGTIDRTELDRVAADPSSLAVARELLRTGLA